MPRPPRSPPRRPPRRRRRPLRRRLRHRRRRPGRPVLGAGPRRGQLQHLLVDHQRRHHRRRHPDTRRRQPVRAAALVNGTTYYYVVTAVNAVGEGAASAQVSAAPAAPTAAPAAPGGVSATAGDALVTLSWAPVPGAVSYDVYWSTTSGVTTAAGTQIPGAADPYVQAALVNGTTYYYVVTAVDAVGEGAASAQVSAAPGRPDGGAGRSGGVSATAGDALVALSWAPVPGAVSYNIYWSTTSSITTAAGTEITGAAEPEVEARPRPARPPRI